MNDKEFTIKIDYGYTELITWLEIQDITESGILVKGMSCRKRLGLDRNLQSCDISPTGAVMFIPLKTEKRSIWKRLIEWSGL